jgi:hypothetical protein
LTLNYLILQRGCLSGQINHVARRQSDRELAYAITSGNIFIYEEHIAKIQQWTDGQSWSSSQLLANFCSIVSF